MNAAMGALRFEGFTLNLSGPSLTRGTKEIPLRPQSLKVLAYLAQHPGRVVSNADLIENCWENPKDTHVNSVAQCLTEIRTALGETKRPIIRTVPRRGYEFAAPVSAVVPAVTPGAAVAGAVPDTPVKSAATAWTRLAEWSSVASAVPRRHALAAVTALIILTAGWAGWAWFMRPAELTMMAMPSLAVLPVTPLGDDSDTTLATLADEIGAGILRAPRGFHPDIRPTSAIKDARADPKTIGRELGVRYILRSLVRREGEEMRINVELIEAENVRQVWVGEFDYRLGQPRAQARAAAFIGRTLVAELLRAEVRRPLPGSPGAGHYTMLGRALMTEEGNAKRNGQAIAYFEKALDIEPGHILGLVHYARAVAIHSLNGWLAENEQDAKLAKAEDAIKRAREKEPKSPGVHVTHGSVLRAKGEHDQAIKAFELALVHNPNFLPAHAELARTLIDMGKPEEAIGHLEKAIKMSPTDISRYWWLYWQGLAALHIPDPERALRFLQDSYSANSRYENTLRLMAVALADLGQEAKARETVKEFLSLRPEATLDDWKRPNSTSHAKMAEHRERMRATLKRLGVPEGRQQAAAKP
jgi:DNA-binding winged helix-turn-helix (wHTH) protein/tetratricopeptide (TPR) repeat protein